MNTLRIILVDDHELVRAGFRALITSINGVDVVAEAADGYAALDLVTKHAPDIVFMDIAMKRMNGLEAIGRIKAAHPEVRVIVLSMHTNEEYVIQALRSGASGYLLKDAKLTDLELAIRTVSRGRTYLSPKISKPVIDRYLNSFSKSGKGTVSPLEALTPRHREILKLIAEGLSTKEVAVKLDLAVKTVDTHRTELMSRLDIHDVAGLVRFAIRSGLVSPEE